MADVAAADFYTGLVARLYGALRSTAADPEACDAFIREHGEPALELGCGDGDPLLELRRRGLEVEGLDSSADMLGRCRAAATAEGLDVVLHHQPMEAMDLPRRYRSIVIAGPTINLLLDDAAVLAALRGIRAHLAPGGAALVPLFVPRPTPPHRLGRPKEAAGPDGEVLRCTTVAEERDEAARLQSSVLRYEVEAPGGHEVLERRWSLHWHTAGGFAALVVDAGLRVLQVLDLDGRPAGPEAPYASWHLAAADG